ncbi:MAG: acyltransferase [Gammaproteobacteria bacterium]|nr:acyltransferase [Gammaproteobacteria bacterium]
MIQGRELSDQKFQMDSLDGLRGFAVLLVILSHTSNWGIYLLPFANFSGNGKSGVILFFVLSSFLLTLPFVKKARKAASLRFLLSYFVRRFFRIYPLYLAYLLLGLLTSLFLWKITGAKSPVGIPFLLTPKEFINHLLLIQGKGLTWSIIVEFHYYFLLPILALTYSLLFNNRIIPSALLTIGLILASQLLWPQAQSLTNDIRLGPYLPVFFTGSFLAVIWHQWEEKRLGTQRNLVIAVEIIGMMALATLFCMIPSVTRTLLNTDIPASYYQKQFMQYGFLWALVLFTCLAGCGLIKKFFELNALRFLGFISFSAYLLHLTAMLIIKKLMPGAPLQGWLILALTIAISTVTWLLIEKPTSKIRLIN